MAYNPPEGTVLVRVGSHRARDRLENLLGELPRGFFSFWFDGEFREIPIERLEEARQLKGITRARVDPEKLCAYWN